MKLGLTLAALAMVAGIGVTTADQPAKAPLLAAIPLHPGSTLLPDTGDSLPAPQLGFTLDSQRLYLVKAAPEAVVKFYQTRLSAHELTSEQFDASVDKAEAGELEGVVFTVSAHDLLSPPRCRIPSKRSRSGHPIARVCGLPGRASRGRSFKATGRSPNMGLES